MPITIQRSHVLAAAAAGLLAVGALTGCSSGTDSASSAAGQVQTAGGPSGAADAAGTAPVERAAGDTTTKPATAGGGSAVVDPAVASRKLTRRADLSLVVTDVGAAAARVRAIATTAGGLVVSEDISSDPSPTPVPEGSAEGTPGPARPTAGGGTITISVPAERLDETLDRLAEVGTVLGRHTATDDVTAQYVDTESRVASARASVERVRALMTRATKLADVVTLESELSRREADLEALESQLAALKGQVALSPVTVQLATEAAALPQPADTGFLAGLAAGWGAFTTSVAVLLTVLGAVLPFAAALALVLVPGWLWWRRRVARPGLGSPAAPPPATPSA